MSTRDLAQYIDHTALHSDIDSNAIKKLCEEATEYGFHSVCVNPIWVALAGVLLRESPVKITAVCGFPLGANRSEMKTVEAMKAVLDSAHEIDMVANIGWLVSGLFDKVEKEVADVRKALPAEVTLKVIIECNKLTEIQQIAATRSVVSAGAQFVKTGTGFYGPVSVEQVMTLARASEGRIEIKAAGGIKTAKQCRELLAAGATRIGASSGVEIVA